MKISSEVVWKIARLARLGLSRDEAALFESQLSRVLDHVADLSRLDACAEGAGAEGAGAEGAGAEGAGAGPGLSNVVRDDAPAPFSGREDILANAPQREGSYFKVRKIL
ncbi:MAG: aspartyl/glutamyl-tRNA amidotransferase subunit C [Elusimicrobia bacterium]|nr:aspartyl/glutamyl-tRNA amidotransferase subunit C [Elusimicrobiota bacterium]